MFDTSLKIRKKTQT